MHETKLKFSEARDNAKLRKLYLRLGKPRFQTFSLPAGTACPGAGICLAWAEWTYDEIEERFRGKRVVPAGSGQGPDGYLCFDASQEAMYFQTWYQRKHNYDLLLELTRKRDIDGVAELLDESLDRSIAMLRWHVSGDWFSPVYLAGAIEFLRTRPWLETYAYTKSLAVWKTVTHKWGMVVPDNLRVTASLGGAMDDEIPRLGLRTAKVVHSVMEAKQLGLQIDKDDYLALRGEEDFALLIHGSQAAGSLAGAAVRHSPPRAKKVNKKQAKLLVG